MTWRDVALRDVRAASRSVGIWIVGGAQLLLFVGVAAVEFVLNDGSFSTYVDSLSGVVAVTIPLVALLLGYKSILAERTGGQLRLALSVPHTRRDVAVGKLVGRSAVFAVPTALALCLAGGVAIMLADGGVPWPWLPWFAGVTVLYGVAFVGLAVGVSLSTATGRRVTVGTIGAYLVTVVLWEDLHTAVLLVLHRFDTAVTNDMPGWALFVRLAAPSESFDLLVRTGFAVNRASRYVDSGAAYVAWPAAFGLLVAWTFVPVALGYLRFKTADL
ncbi:ABC transporter permease subunit [Haloplanus salilacus]|uniref:ABC transporter permease subunit n=1 Tax=Haloplanus salilacus TaxID=2949994 RepID=UPI0030CAE4F0